MLRGYLARLECDQSRSTKTVTHELGCAPHREQHDRSHLVALAIPALSSLCNAPICLLTLFIVSAVITQPTFAQSYATRVSLGTPVGSGVYSENSGWNTGAYASSGYGIQYSNQLSASPWQVRYTSGNRANTALHASRNRLTLNLASRTHTISTYSGGGLSGDITIGDFGQNGSYLEVISGTVDNDNSSGNRLLNGYYGNKDGLFKVGAGGRYFGYHGYNAFASKSSNPSVLAEAEIEVSSGGYASFRGPVYNSYGSYTTGRLEALTGGDIQLSSVIYNGFGGSSTGYVNVNGSGSTFRSSTFYNGYTSGSPTYSGYLDIDNNGLATVNGTFYNGFNDGGRVELTTGGVLDVNGTAYLGNYGGSTATSLTYLYSGSLFDVSGSAFLGNSSRTHNFYNRGGTFSVGGTLNMQYGTRSLYSSESSSAVLKVGAPTDIVGASGSSFRWNTGKVQFTDPVVALNSGQLGSYTQQRGIYRLYSGMTVEADGTLSYSGAPISLLGGTVAAANGLNLSATISGYGTVNATVNGGNLVNTSSTMNVGGLTGGSGSHTVNSTMHVGTNNQSTAFGGSISGGGNLNKTGGGTLSLSGNITPGTVSVSQGTLALTGGKIDTNTFSLSGGSFNFVGGELNVGTFNGNLVQGGGQVTIGASPGNTNVNGGYTQNSGSLEIELGGTTAATEFDTLTVTGTAALGGDLDVSLIDLGGGVFEPQWGQSFQILSASSVSGTFANENLPTLADDLYLTVDYQSTAVSLGVALTGDFNGDGLWDDIDLDMLADAAINDPVNPFYDLDGNGTVEFTASLSGVNSDSDFFLRTLMNTQYGDANLDGKVNVLDLDQLGQGFQGSGTGWLFGDFDGTGGAANVLDLDLLGQTFGFDNSLAPAVAVPEPAGIVSITILGSLISGFRIKKR